MFISNSEVPRRFAARIFLLAKTGNNCKWGTGYAKSDIQYRDKAQLVRMSSKDVARGGARGATAPPSKREDF